MIQVNRIYLIFNRLVTKNFLWTLVNKTNKLWLILITISPWSGQKGISG